MMRLLISMTFVILKSIGRTKGLQESSPKWGDGDARSVYLFCKQEIRPVRIWYPPQKFFLLIKNIYLCIDEKNSFIIPLQSIPLAKCKNWSGMLKF